MRNCTSHGGRGPVHEDTRPRGQLSRSTAVPRPVAPSEETVQDSLVRGRDLPTPPHTSPMPQAGLAAPAVIGGIAAVGGGISSLGTAGALLGIGVAEVMINDQSSFQSGGRTARHRRRVDRLAPLRSVGVGSRHVSPLHCRLVSWVLRSRGGRAVGITPPPSPEGVTQDGW